MGGVSRCLSLSPGDFRKKKVHSTTHIHVMPSTASEQLVINLENMRGYLHRILSVCGPREDFEDLLDIFGEHAGQVTNAGGFYAGNGIKLVRLADDATDTLVEQLIQLAADRGFSAYVAAWALPQHDLQVLEAFQRAESRKDATIKPFKEMREGLAKLGIEAKITRNTASGYELLVAGETKERWTEIASIFDTFGVALKHDGRFIVTRERRAEQKRQFLARCLTQFGVVGLHRQFYEIEFRAALEAADITPTPNHRVYPAYGLLRGEVAYVVEGLTGLDQAALQRSPIISPWRKELRFNLLERLVQQEEERVAGWEHRAAPQGTAPQVPTDNTMTSTNLPPASGAPPVAQQRTSEWMQQTTAMNPEPEPEMECTPTPSDDEAMGEGDGKRNREATPSSHAQQKSRRVGAGDISSQQ
eukprot:TRINITY_DN2430_c0_g1_i11.p2 TRINITY_DN2430_c0_g1~~TRINITY_DN2430_c0_g1_i11.p2  ORF type:complete len:416 (+),score=43.30 TRINITY_DN2430_c0_g1_i11:493-1740(+)